FSSGLSPMNVTLAAVGVSLAAATVKSIQLGAAMDGALRQISAASPGVGQNLQSIRADIDGITDASGRQQSEILEATEQIARLGVASQAELKAKLEAATLIADATGTQLGNAVDGIDQLSDAFNLSTGEI